LSTIVVEARSDHETSVECCGINKGSIYPFKERSMHDEGVIMIAEECDLDKKCSW
jgi:hypothetical protein